MLHVTSVTCLLLQHKPTKQMLSCCRDASTSIGSPRFSSFLSISRTADERSIRNVPSILTCHWYTAGGLWETWCGVIRFRLPSGTSLWLDRSSGCGQLLGIKWVAFNPLCLSALSLIPIAPHGGNLAAVYIKSYADHPQNSCLDKNSRVRETAK